MDRRFIWAIVLMLVIAVAPVFLTKKSTQPQGGQAAGPRDTTPTQLVEPGPAAPPSAALPHGPGTSLAEDTVLVSSSLYTYSISTRGGRLIQGTLTGYKSMAHGEKDQPLGLVPDGGGLLGLAVVVGSDTLSLADWDFTPSTKALTVTGPAQLTLSATHGGLSVELSYRFRPDDYRIEVAGRLTGIGPNGGTLRVAMGDGLRQTEADSAGNFYEFALVTRDKDSELHKFQKLTFGETATFDGPFRWVALKSKYFVVALLALDTTESRINGATATTPPGDKGHPTRAEVWLGIPLGAAGSFGYTLYAGPMEYDRLKAIGHDFDDVNPYGWAWLRPIIRPVAVAVRWLFVWMHQHLHLAYGLVLIIFGVLVRLVLWPLNQRGMRASMKMQAIQPELKELQERLKNDPQKMQSEVMKLYKVRGVNPLGGCLPLMLPMPVLFALFFVFQYTIELRGAPFLWLADLSQKDPYFVLPVLMGLSMFLVNKVGQLGMPPNPQMKMMLYMMPAMMTFFLANFASGLNLYYTVQNLASIPQQWVLAQERLKKQPPAPPPAPVKQTKKK